MGAKAASASGGWLRYLSRNRYEVQAQASPAAAPDAQRTLVGLLYKLDLGQPPSRLVETGTLTLSQHNVECSATMRRHCQISGNKVIIEATPEKELADPVPPSGPGWTDAAQIYFLRLMDVDIEPDTGMAGVVGDVIKSAKPGSRVRHFVTPKKTDELTQPYVEFKVVGTDATQFTELFEWEGGEEGSAPDKRKVSRATTGMTSLKIRTKKDKVVVDEMQVWVVWCDLRPEPVQGNTGFYPYPLGSPSPIASRFDVSKNALYSWRFRFTILPSEIITDPEHPALEGSLPDTAQSFAPGNEKPWPLNPTSQDGSPIDGDSAIKKWDVSRQMKMTFRNPNLVPQADLQVPGINDVWIANQLPPKTDDIVAEFPAGDAEGNDDPATVFTGQPLVDEDDDPYNDHSNLGVGLGHPVGQLSSVDAPGFAIPNSWGGTGRSFSKEADFREFARVHLWDERRSNGVFWFRVSDFYSWHHRMKAQWNSQTQRWEDAGSSPPPPTF